MERRYWALIVIDEAGAAGLSPLQLQKSLFLIGKNLSDELGDSYYTFVPYNYGPFDAQVYSDAQYLIQQGLVRSYQITGRNWSYYTITETGQRIANHVRQTELSERASQYVTRVISWIKSLTFAQLLAAIYQAYPEYKAKSVFVS